MNCISFSVIHCICICTIYDESFEYTLYHSTTAKVNLYQITYVAQCEKYEVLVEG